MSVRITMNKEAYSPPEDAYQDTTAYQYFYTSKGGAVFVWRRDLKTRFDTLVATYSGRYLVKTAGDVLPGRGLQGAAEDGVAE